MIEANAKARRDCGTLLLQTVTADETDTEAMANGSSTRPRIDLEAIAYRNAQAEGLFEQGPVLAAAAAQDGAQAADQPGRFCRLVCVGGANARLDGNGAGARGVMLTFDDFRIGMKQFGQRSGS